MTPEQLREARSNLGLTQKQMAAALATPFRTYQDWENGVARIPGMCAVALQCIGKKRKRGNISRR